MINDLPADIDLSEMTDGELEAILRDRILIAFEPFRGMVTDDLVLMRMAKAAARERAIFIAEVDHGLTREYATKLVDEMIRQLRADGTKTLSRYIIALHDRGISFREIGLRFGITQERARQIYLRDTAVITAQISQPSSPLSS